MRDQLRALAARQSQGEGWEGFVVITGTPEWAARPPSGCERSRIGPTNRMPRTDALPAYQKLVRDILRAARKEQATLRYWAPWNEPNHPYSSSPQRAAPCGAAQPSVSAGPYVEVANALRTALRKAPGDQRYVIGEVAVMVRRLSVTTTVNEFLEALPAKLLCGARAWTQHTYIGGEDVLDDVDARLKAKGCGDMPIWMTETGAGAPRTATSRTGGRPAEIQGCRARAPDPEELVPRPADHRRGPVHAARGRRVPDRARHDRPRPCLSGAEGVAAVGPAGTRAPRGSAARQTALRLSPSSQPVLTR